MKKEYILIIGTIPNKENEKDGMIQRELAIDTILCNENRIYIQKYKKLGFITNFLNLIIDKIKVNKFKLERFKSKKVKLYRCISEKQLYTLFHNAKKIYVHSIYKLKDIPLKYIEEFSNKIILDIHGCVVEEMIFQEGNKQLIEKISTIEEKTFPIISCLISVSNNMEIFYKEKYKNIRTPFISLPIFSREKLDTEILNNKTNSNIIYSGGTQKWQNTDIMIESMVNIPNNYNLTILTPNINTFREKFSNYSLNGKKLIIKTVNSNELKEEYKQADFGYILRDDCIVNKVACPTKIIEYLQYGIIPIVLQPNIGDFNNLGYSYILNNDFKEGKIPTAEELQTMRINNYKILNNIYKIQENGKQELLKQIQ